MSDTVARFRRLLWRSVIGGRQWSVAKQVFLLQAALVVLLVLSGVLALFLQSERDTTAEARRRSVAVAETFAHSPGVLQALAAPQPSKVLQPITEAGRKAAGVDFIVVMDTQGIRYTHPIPSKIGQRFVGTIGPSLAGQTYTESVHGPLGREMQATVPIEDAHGKVTALVSAGLKVKNVTSEVDRQIPIILTAGAGAFVVSTGGTALVGRRLRRQTHSLAPDEMTRMYEHHDTVLHSVREGVLIVGDDGRLLLANDEARRLLRLPPDAEGSHLSELPGLDPETVELLASGREATDEVLFAGERLLAVNQRPTDHGGAPGGTVVTLRDTTELQALSGRAEVARERLKLLYDAGLGVGTSLDVRRTAEELARIAVPRFADYVTVDLDDGILHGEEPAPTAATLRRIAVHGIRGDHPLYEQDRLIDFKPFTPQARGYGSGHSELVPDLAAATDWRAQDPERTENILEYGIQSLISAPIRARGVVLGIANFYRAKRDPFDEEDLTLADELVARAAVSVDNARRYAREHTLAVTLQRSLLPRALPEQSALDVAYRYLPAQSGVSGDWFDVIPLPGSRVALVVGDVVGHGLHAAATMGRLRTAVHNFSTLDLPPDELLSHLDDLVGRIDQDEGDGEDSDAIVGATCLYAIYDPITRRCAMARAGHLAPALVHPDGSVTYPELPGGPPLGLGGMPFQTAELELAEGTQLVLYTDGLIEDRARDLDEGLELLRRALAGHPDRSPDASCGAVLEELLPEGPKDDVALLVARTRALTSDQVADWDVPADPSAVAGLRRAVTERLEEWGLDEQAFGMELVLSELVTNAIRYGSGPIRLRLIRDRALICEVADGSNTSPHLRYAATTDEGGRGLFLVQQMTERWGTRYSPQGKVIWAEMALRGAPPVMPEFSLDSFDAI
ncbi:SpoIIE family protein phosphatase [Streptomyces murinus]|uniref:Serine phosphatase RsbU (Regulator of sigma subunit)/PAS domain-containing protein/anti-sigma regulatory factor (Ser/Thr protein kinase) n=1 Tax=Streptomyces murinus TaxID=33900 RepID=A0A7W3NTW4_STRMR|nr:SpoIIE family protein phosphatase [Streptomyces murinus]MBA9056696.1 serine phosphatase RsbU (regulator of sigma subunit)/PAS domain-containing protein/anti-sigma regulatory factor (Ser/Thr protein kinase) [Streptomyces murinus]UWW91126.1 SpoIIE family protein phosphatase [Streptomyces murinus]